MFCCTLLYVHSSIAISYLIIYLYSQFVGNVFVSMIENAAMFVVIIGLPFMIQLSQGQ